MKFLTFSILFVFSTMASGAPSMTKEERTKKNEILSHLIDTYASSNRISAQSKGFYTNNVKKNLDEVRPSKKIAKKAKKSKAKINVQQFQFEVETIQQDLRQIKFDAYIIGGQIKNEVAQRYCNEQNLRMLKVAISVLRNEEYDAKFSEERAITSESVRKRQINFLVKGSCVAYRN